MNYKDRLRKLYESEETINAVIEEFEESSPLIDDLTENNREAKTRAQRTVFMLKQSLVELDHLRDQLIERMVDERIVEATPARHAS